MLQKSPQPLNQNFHSGISFDRSNQLKNFFAKLVSTIGIATCFVAFTLAKLPSAEGGLAASEVVVVINGNSLNSRTLANHYVALRQIPAVNVIVLDQVPNSEVTSVSEFRDRILRPLLAEIDRRQLGDHIQCISYSADFPTAIDISEDLKPLGALPKHVTRKASINALTFYYLATIAGNAETYAGLNSNFYARQPIDAYFRNPGGTKTAEQWDEIEGLLAADSHAAASEKLEALLEIVPEQFPIAYLAASQAAMHGDTKNAIRLLNQAINLGWSAGGYLAQDKRFDLIRDSQEFQLLELSLFSEITDHQRAIGFDAKKSYTPNGIATRDPSKGFRYLLSTVLGVTRGGGTSLADAIEALKRSASADFSFPEGGFYYCLTGDIRTKTREPGFNLACDELEQLGYTAEVVKSALPRNKPQVLGAQIGTPSFDWNGCGSRLTPGAIVENLTSHGGIMSNRSGQTKLSRLIEAGAAGSSGTVIEPYAIQAKFPDPFLYVHYARGASLAEAFYSSVTGPYQLLIVGDPLCQPFSHAPMPLLADNVVSLPSANDSLASHEASSTGNTTFLKTNEKLNLELNLDAPSFIDWIDAEQRRASFSKPFATASVAVLFDGQSPKTGSAKARVEVSFEDQPEGYHEVRLRFVADDPLEQRREVAIPIWLGEPDSIKLEAPEIEGNSVSLREESIRVIVQAQKAERITLWHDFEQIAFLPGSEGEFKISLKTLGMGPVRLIAKAELPSERTSQSLPLTLSIEP